MKKFITFLFALAISTSFVFAQDAKKAPADKTVKTAPAKSEPAKTDAKASGPTKKDGTPDMRYKENKDAKAAEKPAGPTKKDGTPDKRYKANKDAPAKKDAPKK